MHEAAAQGRVLELEKLIKNGALVNIVAVDSITPLHEACIQGQTQCVKLLLEAGAHVKIILNAFIHHFSELNKCIVNSVICKLFFTDYSINAEWMWQMQFL